MRVRYNLFPVLVCAAVAVWVHKTARAQSPVGPTPATNRIVHAFDFDERSQGNLEDIPKFWEPLRPVDFPYFAQGAFDHTVGRSAPPSFHLQSEGRHVAYQYTGPDTRIRVNTDYRIEGYIRADRLIFARACLSAHYLDTAGKPLPETLVRSSYIGGSGTSDKWIRVDLQLGAAPTNAQTIGLIGWVVQESKWRSSPPRRRSIPRNDVAGGAWFDDIKIYSLPRVAIRCSAPANLFASDGTQKLLITLADSIGVGIEGRCSIISAEGKVVASQSIPVSRGESPDPTEFSVAHLAPGVYLAHLEVFADNDLVVTRSLTFARLADLRRGTRIPSRAFGIVMDPRKRLDPETELELLKQQSVGTVKIPVWTGLADEDPSAEQRKATDRFLQSLVKRGVALVGVFSGPPSDVVRSGDGFVRPLIDLLADDPEGWKEQLSAVVAPYAGTFRSWQVGPDLAPPRADVQDLRLAIQQLREEIRPYISVPRLSLPVEPAMYPAIDKLPVEEVTASIGSDVQIAQIKSQIQRLQSLGFEYVSAYVEPLPADRYRRIPRLADWAQRVITARHAGATTVYAPQTWHVGDDARNGTVEPQETMLIFRTIADVLGDANPGPILRVAQGVHCLAFHDGNKSILAFWDPHAPDGGSTHAFQMGMADQQIDLWGVATALERDDRGRQIVKLSSTPVFVPGVERWLVDFRSGVRVNPDRAEFGHEQGVHTIEMNYRGDVSVFGEVHLIPPPQWRITPRNFGFALSPRRSEFQTIHVQVPHSESAGRKWIRAAVQLAGDSYELEIPLAVDVGLSDLDVWGLAVAQGNDLFLRHVVKNRSSKVLSFRATASVPGRERQYRPIPNLRPGEIQSVEYRFHGAANLAGRNARLVLREVNDGPRRHNLEKTIP